MNERALIKIAREYVHLGNGFPQPVVSDTYKEFIKRQDQSLNDHLSMYGSLYGSVKPRAAMRSEDAPVYDFYKDIVPNIRKRELNVDELPLTERNAFGDIMYTYVKKRNPSFWQRIFGGGINGDYSIPRGMSESGFDRPVINIVRGEDEKSTLAHEFRHDIQHRGVPLIGDSLEKLKKEYAFYGLEDYAHLPREVQKKKLEGEMRTTNAELQYGVYQSLRDMLGRKPTFEDYEKHINSMSDEDIIKLRQKSLNGYDQNAKGFWRDIFNMIPKGSGGKERADRIRDLLLNVTKNDLSRERNTSVFA